MENVKIEPQILIEIIPSVGQEDQLQVQAEREPIDVETEAAYDELDTSTYEACHEEDDELNSSGTSKGKDLKQVTLPEMFKMMPRSESQENQSEAALPESFEDFKTRLEHRADHPVEAFPCSSNSIATSTPAPKSLKRGSETLASHLTCYVVLNDCFSAGAQRSRHPLSEMVKHAIEDLSQRADPTVKSIEKFIFDNYEVDSQTLSQEIRDYLKSATKAGRLIRVQRSYKFPEEARRSKRLEANRMRKEIEDAEIQQAKKMRLTRSMTPKRICFKERKRVAGRCKSMYH